MSIFFSWTLWMFPVLGIFAFIEKSQKQNRNIKNEKDNIEFYKASFLFTLIVFLPMILLAGTREQYSGGDTWLYVDQFNEYPNSISELSGYITWKEKDPGFIIFSTIIKQFFGPDYHNWLMIIALISGVCLVIGFRNYSTDVVLCAFLFFASTDYNSWMRNGIRQFLVASILFAVFPLVQKKKWIRFIAIVLLLYTFHSSVLLVIPLYFCAVGKAMNKKTLLVIAVCLIAVVFVGNFTNLLSDVLESTTYNTVVDQFDSDDGTNILRVLVYSIPALFALIYRKKIDDSTPEIINISINMSLITMGLYIVSMFTSGIYIGRLPIYFSLFNYILLPWEIDNFLKPEQRKSCYTLMIIGYICFYIFNFIIDIGTGDIYANM